jgi:hypothetical protein
MNEDRIKLRLGKKREFKRNQGWISSYIKPSGRFWKRFFNKKVRQGLQYKRGNWHEWC